FRTAPTHFASKKTELYIVSTADRKSWRFEQRFYVAADMREPRFAIYHDTLFFYFFEAGTNPAGFTPEKMWATHFTPTNGWAEITDLGLDGFVPWRIRVHGDVMYMSAYYGRDVYKKGKNIDLRLYTSRDGYTWAPISPEPQTGDHGGEEGEFIFDAAGNLWGTVRQEGAGAMLVYAHRDSLAHWHTYPTRDKYDSALLFSHQDEIYLIARRNLDGAADKATWLPIGLRRWYNLLRYSLTRKTTALWHFDKDAKRLRHLMDFPATGDTAFPAITPLEDGKWLLMNYSSDIHGPQKNWLRGQVGKTFIYQTVLELESN
ncbi:MAG: hypothetical protein AAF570_23865, partial [Bacteroidota bacterium]